MLRFKELLHGRVRNYKLLEAEDILNIIFNSRFVPHRKHSANPLTNISRSFYWEVNELQDRKLQIE